MTGPVTAPAGVPGLPPTGEQWTIEGGGYAATVVQAGGGIRTLTRDGAEVLAGYPADGPVVGARGQLLLPWPNRIRDGAYCFGGRDLQLPVNEVARHNASHGLARWCAWRPLEVSTDALLLGCRLLAQPGYPWTLDLQVAYRVDAGGLTVTVSATNRADDPAPFAAGMHPYLAPRAGVDAAVLEVSADTHLCVDDRMLPTDTEPVAGTLDFRGGRTLGDAVLDDAFTDLARDGRGVARASVDDVELWLGPQWRWVQVFTGDTLPDDVRRRSVAVEPMTAPPDAFNSGQDLVTLSPGEQWSGSFGFSRRDGSARRSAPGSAGPR